MSKRSKKDWGIGAIAIVFFLFVIGYCIKTNFRFYIADSVIFILFTVILLAIYEKVFLDTRTFLFIVVSLVLHDLGAFRFYASSPLPIEWDIITHVFGIFAVTCWIYNAVEANLKKRNAIAVLVLVVLAGLGFGVLIEFVEFYGFATTGFGEGFFGRGYGDFDPRIVSSDYIDTIQDLFWNTVGTVIGFIASAIKRKRE